MIIKVFALVCIISISGSIYFKSLVPLFKKFEIFIEKITNGGILVYNENDPEVKRVSEAATNPIRKLPYATPEYSVSDGVTLLKTPEGDMPIEVFGAHNLPWETTVATGKAVAIVALSIVAQCLVQLMIRAFHALKDTKTPFLIALLTTFFYLVGCFVIIKFSSLGINGIATIISLTAVLELSLFVIFLERKIGNFTTKNLFVPQAKMLVAAFLMSIFLYLPFKVLDELVFETSRTIELIGLTVVTSTIGLLVYLYLAYLLNIHELQIVRKVLQSIGSWRKSLTKTPEVMIETTQDDGIV